MQWEQEKRLSERLLGIENALVRLAEAEERRNEMITQDFANKAAKTLTSAVEAQQKKRTPVDVRKNFELALAEPTKWCCSDRCPDTNWGGYDRLHTRMPSCPVYNADELRGYIERTETSK